MICATKIQWRELSAAATLMAAFLLCLWGGQMQETAYVASLSAQSRQVAPEEYLSSLGWECSGQPECDQVQMPEQFGDAYASFLQLQQKGGFDLTGCAGQVVTRYTFPLANYPSEETGIVADVMVLDGRIVGGEIRSPALDGFMAPLVARADMVSGEGQE